MKILCISHKYPPQTGGMEKQSYELISGLSKTHKVISIKYIGQGSKILWLYNLKRKIKKALRQHPDINIIHLNDGLIASICAWLKKYTHIPVLATLHGLDITFPSRRYQRWIIPKLHRMDGIICVSEASKNVCLGHGFSPSKLHVVMNGVDHDIADIAPVPNLASRLSEICGFDISDHKIIVGLGRAVRRKGFSWFASKVMPHLGDKIIFLVIGPYQNKELKLLNLLKEEHQHKISLLLGLMSDSADLNKAALSMPNRVIQTGRLDFHLLMNALSYADLFIMPNIPVPGDAEGFGLVALEASMRGCPVLASNLEGITSAIHHQQNGILIESQSIHQWVSTCRHLLNQDEQCKRLGVNGKAYTIKHFSWEKMVLGYIEVFASMID